MRLASLVRSLTLALTLVGFAAIAQATPITYVETGFASGTIGGTTFTNALVQLTLSGDTGAVLPIFGGIAVATTGTTTVNIAGFGTATITDPTEIVSTQIPISIDTGFPVLPYVVFGTVDSPPSLESITGLGVTGNNALLGYNLTTSIGPITGFGGVGYPTTLIVHTTAGDLHFTSDFDAFGPTSQSTFSATLGQTAVPEPTSLLLFGTGIAAVASRSRFRAKRSRE